MVKSRKKPKVSKPIKREKVFKPEKKTGFIEWLKEDLKRTTKKEYRWLLWLAVILVVVGLFILSWMFY